MFAPYALPGSQQLADACGKAFQYGADCVILQNHGVVAVGKDLNQAYERFVSLEYLARSIVNAMSLRVPLKPLTDNILKFANDLDNESSDNPFPRNIAAAPVDKHVPRVLDG
jgi:ribulose-5-phosphate 4-epimerase/fuculose-1-phosphate aldolase